MAISLAVTYGINLQRNRSSENEVAEIKKKLDAEASYNEEHYVKQDLFNQCITEIKRRLDGLDAIEISAQLAEIKVMIIALKEQLTAK